MKKILGVHGNNRGHWVGNGFPVRSLFTYEGFGQALSPFLMLDYAGPRDFTATTEQRGVGTHPHRGFETVTIVYSGEVAHRDSSGGGGTIGPGDVQWMTAGRGILHEEFHSPAYAQSGGPFEMVQLWVNLPAQHKMTAPRYQGLLNSDIPVVELPDGAGRVRVIAGTYAGHEGPAQTFSPVDVWDVRLQDGKRAAFTLPEGRSLAVVVLEGTVEVNGEQLVREAQFALLDQAGRDFTLEANGDSKLLVLSGEPLNEPIEGYGPFVMNTKAEIRQAIEDYNSGRFGAIPG
jgi:redox-sensitive bicupin YhaK (pirin superfamily)